MRPKVVSRGEEAGREHHCDDRKRGKWIDKPASRRGYVARGQESESNAAEADFVAAPKRRRTGNAAAVDVAAVGRAEIGQDETAEAARNRRMAPRHSRVRKHDIVAMMTADRERAFVEPIFKLGMYADRDEPRFDVAAALGCLVVNRGLGLRCHRLLVPSAEIPKAADALSHPLDHRHHSGAVERRRNWFVSLAPELSEHGATRADQALQVVPALKRGREP